MGIEKKFLIVKLSAIGDIVHALPVAHCLRTFYPNATIDWVVGDKFKGILENNPSIDNIIVADLSNWRKNWFSSVKKITEFNKMLQKNDYDYVIDLQGLFKSAVITAFSGGKKRIGYSDGREFSALALNVKVEPKAKRPYRGWHVIKRYLDLLVCGGIIDQNDMQNYVPKSQLPESEVNVKNDANKLLENIDKTKPIVVFAPATTWKNKHWDVKEWQKLYLMLKDMTNIIFTGIEKDEVLINEITEGNQDCTMLAGKTGMELYVEVLRRADLIISPDSGACHIGFALKNKFNKPKIITIFCATSKDSYKSLAEGDLAFPLEEHACVPCHKRKCEHNTMECTKYVKADEVFKNVCLMLDL